MGSNFIFAGCDTRALANEYGTPLYVVSEDFIVERCREIRRDFLEKYADTRAVFASKALLTLEICRIMEREGLGMDAVSGGELYTEIKAGMTPANIIFHGNAKSRDELEYAVANRIGIIVVDNMSELLQLEEVAAAAGVTQEIMFRVTPGVDSHTHKFISTAQEDSKFGIDVNQVLGEGYVQKALELPHVKLSGFHFHVGSQLLENDSHLMAADVILKLVSEVREAAGFTVSKLNLGGGFGIQYAGDPERKPLSYFMDPLMTKITDYCLANSIKRPEIIIEPGRWIVGEAGITLYDVTSVKVNGAGRRLAGINGGFPDNPRTALYEAKYDVIAADRADEPRDFVTTIAGKCCESGDILIWDAMLPELGVGDLLAVLSTGAYNYTMASNYNRVPRPAMVMLKNGTARLTVKRETYEDMLKNEI